MNKQEKLLPGGEYTLTAVRESDLGVFLDAQTGNTSDDILLHKAQQTQTVKVGDTVKVSLYLDPKKRLAASMRFAKIQEGEIARVPVINVTRQGAFVDIGAERGVFLPYSQMRGRVEEGQLVWVKLYRDKSGRQAVSMKVEEEIKKQAKPVKNVKVGESVVGTVYNELDDGWLLITEEKYIAFLHKDETKGQKPSMGAEISGRITFIREDGRINISQKEQKEVAIVTDAQKILDFLQERQGSMPYGDSTPPDIIKDKFDLSKAAFKRALGQLMKQGKVKQEAGWTSLIKVNDEKGDM